MTVTPQLINLGAAANDGTGDTPRVAGQKINAGLKALADAVNATPSAVPVKVDGTSITQASDGTISVPTVAPGSLPEAASLTAASLFVMGTGSKRLDAVQTWLAANDGSLDISTLETLSAVPTGGFAVFGFRLSDGAPKLLSSTALGSSSGGTGTGSTGTGSTGGGGTGGGGTTTPTTSAAAMTMTSPTYAYRTGSTGPKMLTGGSGSVPVTLPDDGKWFVKAYVYAGAGGNFNTPSTALQITNGSGTYVGAVLSNNGIAASDNGGQANPGGPAVKDGAVHQIALESASAGINVYTDGTAGGGRNANTLNGACTLSVALSANGDTLVTGIYDVRVYAGSMSAPGELLGEWQLDASGAAS